MHAGAYVRMHVAYCMHGGTCVRMHACMQARVINHDLRNLVAGRDNLVTVFVRVQGKYIVVTGYIWLQISLHRKVATPKRLCSGYGWLHISYKRLRHDYKRLCSGYKWLRSGYTVII